MTLALYPLRLPSLRRLVVEPRGRLLCRCSSQQGGQDPSPSDDFGSSLSRKDFARSMSGKGFGKLPDKDKPSTTDALISSLGELAQGKGRASESNNVVLGSDDTEKTWRELDGQVNEYPGQRTFKAIGSGGEEFKDAMVKCAEKVVGPLHEECVSVRASTKGNYTSVTLSVWVESPDQVVAIYQNMKEDHRLRFFF